MKDITVKQLVGEVMKQAKEKGFGTKPSEIDVAEKIALIHSEVSEAFEAYRHKNIDGEHGFTQELGDAVQRILHLCGIFDVDIAAEIIKKISSNKNRDWKWEKMNEKIIH
jgi:NTP pyrophosphatase (non-canonical NTP hydrolase)